MSHKEIIIELTCFERDFILNEFKWSLDEDLINQLQKARSNKNQFIRCKVKAYQLQEMIGNLSLEANHNKNRQKQETAYYIAELLESYQRNRI